MIGSIIAGGVSVIAGVTQSIIAGKKAKKMQEAIDGYERQDLTNAYKDTTVSTRSAELQREELARSTASSVQALRSGGVRALGALGGIQEANSNTAQGIGADLDKQQNNIELLRAQDEARIQGLQEDREVADLAGMGNELNTQRQNSANGINNSISGLGTIAGGMMGGGATGKATDTKGFEQKVATQSAGIVTGL
tara:strand:- start:11351 stop:11935 length:585 start_codon:yes stop_codon:yes gene_type:complete